MEERLWQDRFGRVGKIDMVVADGRVTWLKDSKGSWWTPTEYMQPFKRKRWRAIEDTPA